jgi:hypothetical protein
MASLAQSSDVSPLGLLMIAPLDVAFGELTASFRYRLANFSGRVLSLWAKLAVDRDRNEICGLNRPNNDIRVFREHGMKIYAFAESIALGDGENTFILIPRYRMSTVHLCSWIAQCLESFRYPSLVRPPLGSSHDLLGCRRDPILIRSSVLVDGQGRFHVCASSLYRCHFQETLQ